MSELKGTRVEGGKSRDCGPCQIRASLLPRQTLSQNRSLQPRSTQQPTRNHLATSPQTVWALSYFPISSPAGTSTKQSCPRTSDWSSSASVVIGILIACDKMKSSTVSIPFSTILALANYHQASPIVSKTSL